MLGHKLWRTYSEKADTFVTLRRTIASVAPSGLFDPKRTYDNVSAQDFDSVIRALHWARPQVVINCIGIVKQQQAAKDPLPSITINALFPHRLAELCGVGGIRLVHISTDCVFSGRRGNYTEQDIPDAEDLYGRTKLLGEVNREGCLTLRTSIIGHEIDGAQGLLEWFLSQNNKAVQGYPKAVFSGFTTTALADIIFDLLKLHPAIEGLWQVAAQPIDKFALLSLIGRVYGLNIAIQPDATVQIDRSLNGTRFHQATGIVAPSWSDMIEAMHADSTYYAQIKEEKTNLVN